MTPRSLLLVLPCCLAMLQTVGAASLSAQRGAATAAVLTNESADLNATAHQSVDAAATRAQMEDQLLLLLIRQSDQAVPVPGNGAPPALANQARSPPLLAVATSPQLLHTLLASGDVVAAALLKRTQICDTVNVQADRGATVDATAQRSAVGVASGAGEAQQFVF